MRIPASILEKFEQAAADVDYGDVSLIVHIKNGAARYVIEKSESFIAPTDEQSVGTAEVLIERK